MDFMTFYHNPIFYIPFIGAGVGLATVKYSSKDILLSGDNESFAMQAIAGLSYDLNSNMALKMQYRYFATTGNIEVSATTGIGGNYMGVANRYADHSILFGLTYNFNKPYQPTSLAQITPPDTVEEMALVIENEVFFGFDKYTITLEAQKIIALLVESVKDKNVTSITLKGYTDTIGSEEYNLILSLKRAKAVKAIMVSEGITSHIITTVGLGEESEGVNKSYNRRVDIFIP